MTRYDAINQILGSIAMEEVGLIRTIAGASVGSNPPAVMYTGHQQIVIRLFYLREGSIKSSLFALNALQIQS